MQLESINTDADHESALIEIERLWDAEEGTPNGDRLEILMTLVEAYEEANFPMDLPALSMQEKEPAHRLA
jgi:HTH-type transcriptional regulator/antitoxin HigA